VENYKHNYILLLRPLVVSRHGTLSLVMLSNSVFVYNIYKSGSLGLEMIDTSLQVHM